MFTDKLGLSLIGDRASRSDQIITLSAMIWEDYEQLTQDNCSSYRISYLNRVITIVSPS